jgi:hypothetical protein
VLVVLAVAGAALAAAARRSFEAAAAAGEAERTLQRKWGMLGIRAVCLPRAETILIGRPPVPSAGADTAEAQPVPVSRRFALTLGGTRFEVTVADEQAKANVNVVHHRRGKRGLEAALRRLQPVGAEPLRVRLRPVAFEEEDDEADVPARYGSFDQLFAGPGPADLAGTGRGGPGVAERITCWGSGKVNVRRAERDVLREACRGCLVEFEIDKLVRLREERPAVTAHEALTHLELDEKRRAEASKLLTDVSTCHSLWIVVRGRTRAWHRLYVHRVGDGGDGDVTILAWNP